MDKKRIILSLLFILLVIAIGYLIYVVFFQKKPTTYLPQTTTPTTTGQFPQTGNADKKPSTTDQQGNGSELFPTTEDTGTKISQTEQVFTNKTQILDVPLSNLSSNEAGGTNFYNQIDGKFYRINKDGKVEALTDKVFYNVQTVAWSPKNDEAIIEYPDGANIYYNFETKKQVTLPKHWQDFSFSSQDEKITAKSIGLSPENRWLITSDVDGNNIKLVEPMGENADKVIVDWSPNNQIIAMSLTGESLGMDRQEVLFVGQHGENFPSTIVEGRGLETKWSSDGNNLLYSVYNARNDYKPELWLVKSDTESIGKGRRLLNLNTWADKCIFADEKTIYCAVPEKLEKGAGFAPSLADTTADVLYKIDVNTGLKSQIPLDQDYYINSMSIDKNNNKLYFTDKNKNGLFEIPI
ncbi:MAG: hypothetical protein WA057_04010 [Candidatus Magasanikiibacteriota bacterium]